MSLSVFSPSRPPRATAAGASGHLRAWALGLGLSLSPALLLAQPVAAPVPAGKAARPVLSVTPVVVGTAMLAQQLVAHGTVQAWQEAVIAAEGNGLRVTELYASVGDKVRKGQRLASFAQETLQAEVRLAQATLQEAQAQATQAQADGARARGLQNSGALSEQQIQQLLTQEQSAQARVASAAAQLAAQQLRLAQTQLLAPDDGLISARVASVGSVVSAGTEMFRLIRKNRLEWRGELSAADLEQVRAGQAVRITSASGSVWNGRVRQIAPTVDPVSRRGWVYVDVLGAQTQGATPLRPGSYVRGELVLGEQAALVVPPTAVVARDGAHWVYVIGPDQRVSQRKVQIGRQSGPWQEILNGVKTGEKLVASGGAFLSDGDSVQLASAKP